MPSTCVVLVATINIWDMSKVSKSVIAIVAVAAVLVAGGVWWFLRDDAPAPVSLDAATGKAGQNTANGTSGSVDDGSDPDGIAKVDGTWEIDSETGDFDWDTATGTFAGFRVEEELANIGSTTAVGRTGEVSGELTIANGSVTNADFSVDLASLQTNNNMRDSRVRSALDTARFPDAKLTLVEPIRLPEDAADGRKVEVTADGRLSLHGVTKDVDLAIEAQYVEGRIVIVGSTEIVFSDFDVEVPSSPVVLSVKDHGVMEFQALMQRK